ncbi:hypothetical protein MMB232_02754 [Brevundimonas subvibrioides]|uniref:DUF805 domain-containing protein n=1 Tax=Brevundimonas subvibrioides TaxID=74313 RepID=UPI0032D574C3
MQNIFDPSGRSGRGAYGLFTFAFAAVVLGLAAGQSDQPFTRLASEPWTLLGGALDALVRIPVPILDAVVSLGLIGAVLGVFVAMTIRRLRDIGQSPWWAVLVMLSGIVVPVMIALSLVPSADREAAKEGAASLTTSTAGAE